MPVVCNFLKQYFEEDKMALFLSSSEDKVFLLYKNEDAYKAGLALLVEIVSLLEAMEKEGLIYCVNMDENTPFFLHNPLDVNVGRDSDGVSFTTSKGCLSINGETIVLKDRYGSSVLKGTFCQTQLAKKISYYFKSIVYPSESLKKLALDGYESLEVLSYKREIKDAKRSRDIAWGALFISLSLPFCVTFFNNKYAKTEIKNSQYDSVVYRMDVISEKMDTLCKHLMLEQKKKDIPNTIIPKSSKP